jgi:hypothetical protein
MDSPFQVQKARIASIYTDNSNTIAKAELNDLEKGKALPMGHRSNFGGKEYIKTVKGWRLVGNNGGKYKDAHDTIHGSSKYPNKDYKPESKEQLEKDVKAYHAKSPLLNQRNAVKDAMKRHFPEGKGILEDVTSKVKPSDIKVNGKEVSSGSDTNVKDATDHLIERKGEHFIDILDPETGEKKFKPGDEITYTDSQGSKHVGAVSHEKGEEEDVYRIDKH